MGCGAAANEYSCAHEAQTNFEDLTPYLTYDLHGDFRGSKYGYTKKSSVRVIMRNVWKTLVKEISKNYKT